MDEKEKEEKEEKEREEREEQRQRDFERRRGVAIEKNYKLKALNTVLEKVEVEIEKFNGYDWIPGCIEDHKHELKAWQFFRETILIYKRELMNHDYGAFD